MAYNILYHNELSISSVEKSFGKTLKQLQDGDFNSADVKKMHNTGFYRARLDIKDRLLFKVVTYAGEKHLLLLEVIKEHDYAHSRFLRGGIMPSEQEWIPIDKETEDTLETSSELSYLHPTNKKIHLLNKLISFDELQGEVLEIAPPLIIIGSAGSGKTAVVLEKLKTLTGSVAYISLSKFLVENAANLYYSDGYDGQHQEAEFLSLNDYLSSWEKPQGKEIDFRSFAPWFARHAQALKLNEPYKVFEEFKGVLTGSPIHTAYLSEKEYLELGIKQSIFNLDDRQKIYPLFIKYLDFLKENNYYDSNITCYQYLSKIKPRYDYVMVDEVQDITNIQLKCILQSLENPSQFILTGDSNQIVHPNFFSWGKVKTYFHQSGEQGKQIKVLQTNYRNSLQVVELSNNLLKIKNTRFGSIDKESNYLINTISKSPGEAILYPDDEKKKNELNRLTQNSTHYAVIVTDSALKDEARRNFKTPLVFSVQEAKGLEYENVILVNFISNHEWEFKQIIEGVTPEDLLQKELTYNRASNKHDKDAEVYKFYINSLYVAITRAIKNIYLFEKRVSHPAFQLLQLHETVKEIEIKEAKSSRDEWLAEAERLEEQGKHEQAEQIRAKYLGYEYLNQEQLERIKELALDSTKKEAEVKKERKQLFEYATHHQRYDWLDKLASLQFQRAMVFMREVRQHRRDFAKHIRLGYKQNVMATLDKYGPSFTTEDGANALMLALYHGQQPIATELLKKNIPLQATDNRGFLAIDYLLDGYLKYTATKQQQLATLNTLQQFWGIVKPKQLAMEINHRTFLINWHSMLFFLLIALRIKEAAEKEKLRALEPTKPNHANNNEMKNAESLKLSGINMDDLEDLVGLIPDEILPAYRKNRVYLNSIMAKNEIGLAERQTAKWPLYELKEASISLTPISYGLKLCITAFLLSIFAIFLVNFKLF